MGGLLAPAQISDRRLAPAGRNAERDAPAGASAVEAENQPRLLRRSAMVERIDAERPVLADQPRRDLLGKIESRPPHQRTVAKHPEVGVGMTGTRFELSLRIHLAHAQSGMRKSV